MFTDDRSEQGFSDYLYNGEREAAQPEPLRPSDVAEEKKGRQTAKLNSVPGCPRVTVLSIDDGVAMVESDEAKPGHEVFTVSAADLSSFEGVR